MKTKISILTAVVLFGVIFAAPAFAATFGGDLLSGMANRYTKPLISESDRMIMKFSRHIADIYINQTLNPGSYKLVSQSIDNTARIKYEFKLNDGSRVVTYIEAKTGEVSIYTGLAQAALETRQDIASRMKVDLKDVYINGIVRYRYFAEPGPRDPIYTFTTRVNRFIIICDYRYNKEIGLKSLISRDTCTDLYANAAKYLKEIFNPDSYTLDSWNVDPNGNIMFGFRLPEGSIVDIRVNPTTGDVWMRDNYLREAVLNVRYDIARRMGLENNIEDVHINSATRPDFSIYWGRTTYISARVGDYAMSVTLTEPGPIYWNDPVPALNKMLVPGYMPPRYKLNYQLNSFIDIRTGVDYVKGAQKDVFNLLNPEGGSPYVVDWGFSGGELKLWIDPYYLAKRIFPYDNVAWARLGGAIAVTVNLTTGAITIDPVVVDAVTNARKDASQKLGVDYGDVHVNAIYQKWEFASGKDSFVETGYGLNVSTPKFYINYTYATATGAITLVTLYNKETGTDLYANAAKYLKEIFNPDAYALKSWQMGVDGKLIFNFELPDGSIVIIGVDPVTGKPYIPKERYEVIVETSASKTLTPPDEVAPPIINSSSSTQQEPAPTTVPVPEEPAAPDQADPATTTPPQEGDPQSGQAGNGQQPQGDAPQIPEWLQELIDEALAKHAAINAGKSQSAGGGGKRGYRSFDALASQAGKDPLSRLIDK